MDGRTQLSGGRKQLSGIHTQLSGVHTQWSGTDTSVQNVSPHLPDLHTHCGHKHTSHRAWWRIDKLDKLYRAEIEGGKNSRDLSVQQPGGQQGQTRGPCCTAAYLGEISDQATQKLSDLSVQQPANKHLHICFPRFLSLPGGQQGQTESLLPPTPGPLQGVRHWFGWFFLSLQASGANIWCCVQALCVHKHIPGLKRWVGLRFATGWCNKDCREAAMDHLWLLL